MALSATAKSWLPRARTSATATPSPAVVGIRGIKRVSAHTVRLAGFMSGWSPSSQDILALCHWFEMVRVDAVAHPAKVIELHPIGDGSNAELVCPAVRVGCSPIQPYIPIPIRADDSAPKPAGVRELYIAPDTKRVVPANLDNSTRAAVFLPSLPMHGAPTARKTGACAIFNRAWFRGNLMGHFGTSIPGVMRQAVSAALPPFIVPKEVPNGSL